ncbi:RNA polymerase III (C) subunit [Phaffia rhodozyma]|uniref:DNA-directed RNA polymerase III subunit RPC3 n=1 Tax=Phaffia rhodozyma TaxID=264483 RepID=A0A0F7SUK5_PHARH|nr:RNA polymerase III (C) subunit [Phaffia rhodozyma]
MSDKEAVRLGHHIISVHFGPQVARVAHPILHRGRLTLPQISKLSSVPPRQVQAALIVLTQHNLLWWTGPDYTGGIEAYEMDVGSVLKLERVGRVVEMGRNEWGDEAASILNLLSTHGKLTLPQILAELAKADPATDASTSYLYSSTSDNQNQSNHLTRADRDSDSENDLSSSSSSSPPPTKKKSKRELEKERKDKERARKVREKEKAKEAKAGLKNGKRRMLQDEEEEEREEKDQRETGTDSLTNPTSELQPKVEFRVDKKKAASVQKTLLVLLRQSFILPYHPSQSISPRDKLITLRQEELAKIRGVIGPKDRNAAWEKAWGRVSAERESWADWKMALRKEIGKSKTKKPKLDDDALRISDSVYLYVNMDRFNVLIRNDLIVKAASDRFNVEAGSVVAAMLKSSHSSQMKVSEIRSDPVTIYQISQAIPRNLELFRGIFDPSSTLDSSSAPQAFIQTYLSLLGSEDNPTSSGQQAAFVGRSKSARDSAGSYQVEFETVCRRLKRRVLDAVVRERWGDDAARVVAVVLKYGKMDEKHISKVAMLSPKDVRVITAALSAASLLELQEVPRTTDRTPARTFYLWHVDLARAYTALISHLYKSMANQIQRKEAELRAVTGLVERRNRVDVRESGGSLLGTLDRRDLEILEEKLMKLTLACQRTDLNVFILRDLPGGPVGAGMLDMFD